MTSQLDLHNQVRAAYTEIALSPAGNRLFPCGRQLAEDLQYPPEMLDSLPGAALEAFCGVGNVSLYASIQATDVVLDVGCGAGLDTILAAGRAAKVIGVDFSLAMLQRAQLCMKEARLEGSVTLLRAEAQSLPLLDASIDVALVNGLFNLNPFREQVFLELARVLRPGGALYCSELVLNGSAGLSAQTSWFS